MIKLIVTGHGHFASGILSSLELIAGSHEEVIAIDYTDKMSQEDIKQDIEKELENVKQVIILCDLLGGTPFKMASLTMTEQVDKEIEVISGLNLSMLMEAVFSRTSNEFNLLIDLIKEAGVSGIINASCLFSSQVEEEIESGF
ncbi:MAG: PTS fructose transporter subunit IIA [Coprobacillus sp.]